MEDSSTDKQHKVHRAPKSGMKYEKKKRTAELRREKLRKSSETSANFGFNHDKAPSERIYLSKR